MNYLMDPKVGAQLATYNRYATANAASRAYISEEDLNNPILNPNDEALEKVEYIKDIGSANRLYDEALTMIKTQ